jgi:hypothetical protein
MIIYEDYRDNVNKFEAVYKKLWKPIGNKDKNNLTSLYFFSIAKAIQKKYALHLIFYLCFLKEMNL